MKECNNVKQSPIAGLAAYGGGSGSVIFGRKGVDGYTINRSLRFNTSDSAYLNRTPPSASNRKTFTISFWVKRGNIPTSSVGIISARSSGNGDFIRFSDESPNNIRIYGDGSYDLRTNAVYRDPSAWYHIVCAIDTTQSTASNRIKLYVNGEHITSFATANYPSQNADTRWNSTDPHEIGRIQGSNYFDGYLADVHFIDGQALAVTALGKFNADNVWSPKKYSGTYGTNGFHLDFSDNSSNAALGTDSSGNSNTWTVNNLSSLAITYSADSNYTSDASYLLDKASPFNGTDPNSKINESTGAITNSNSRGVWSNTARSYIRWDAPTAIPITSGVDFYGGAYNDAAEVATLEIYYTDGTSTSGTFTSSSSSYMGRLQGVSSGKSLDYVKVSCANACFTGVRVNGSFIDDQSGDVIDSLIDTPTNYEADSGNNGGNYATLNPLAISPNVTPTVSNGNLEIERTATSSEWTSCGSTFVVSSGKYYWELSLPTINGTIARWGVADADDYEFNRNTSSTGLPWLGSGTGTSWSMDVGGNTYHNGSTVSSSYTSTVTTSNVIGVALDCDANTLTFYKNGTSLGVAHSNVTASRLVPAVGLHGATHNKIVLNFGQRPFAYTPPSNHLALCTQNLADPTIADGSTAMDVLLYTGDGQSSKAVTGYGFSPDLLWIKERSSTSDHGLWNTVVGSGKYLSSNATAAEYTTTTELSSIDSAGFTVGSSGMTNQSSQTYVAWAWDAGTSTVHNTDGSITSNVRANASAGFSIVSYTGTGGTGTVGHGLSATPHLIIVKNRDEVVNWVVAHNGLSSNRCLALNSNSGDNTIGFTGLNKSNFTSSTFTVNYSDTNLTYVNASNDKYIAYCFAPVEGFSAFGKYTGNGSSDGPFVHTGFRVAWLLTKRTDGGANNWQLIDSTRSPFNVADDVIKPDENAAETTHADYSTDFLSNGFKHRTSHVARNGNGNTYIYIAFAEHPFKTVRAR